MPLASADPKFRVAICGAGIGGLALAVIIGKFADQDIHIDLYEVDDVGIALSSRTTEIMKELDISFDKIGM